MVATPRKRKIAIIHDWLVVYAGAEKVLEHLLDLWPEADLFSLVDFLEEGDRGFLKGRTPRTSFIQKLPLARRKYRQYLPLMPLAIEQFDLSEYDVIISSSHAVAKGVITSPSQIHISYVHSPMRYAWDLQHQYLRESGMTGGMKSFIARALLHYMRMWDLRTVNGVDVMLANSQFIARRIQKVYRHESTVVYPPVDTEGFALCEQKEDFYVTASRMVPYKMIPTIVEAFRLMPDKQLYVIGTGPDMDKVLAAAGPNVIVLGHQPFDVLRAHLQHAKAFIFAAEEDFGITPVEAQACGTPVIAYGRGGSLETVRGIGMDDAPTGVFFDEQTPEAIAEAVQAFEQVAHTISPRRCREHAQRFSAAAFRRSMTDIVRDATEPRLPGKVLQLHEWAANS